MSWMTWHELVLNTFSNNLTLDLDKFLLTFELILFWRTWIDLVFISFESWLDFSQITSDVTWTFVEWLDPRRGHISGNIDFKIYELFSNDLPHPFLNDLPWCGLVPNNLDTSRLPWLQTFLQLISIEFYFWLGLVLKDLTWSSPDHLWLLTFKFSPMTWVLTWTRFDWPWPQT